MNNDVYKLYDYKKPPKHRITYNHDELCLIAIALDDFCKNSTFNEEYKKVAKKALIKTAYELENKPSV